MAPAQSSPDPGFSSSPEEEEEEEEEDGAGDETDSRLSAILLNTVKAVVLYLLNHVIKEFRTEICNGCTVNHPSQRRHDCLEDAPDYFYLTYFKQLNGRLWTDKLIPAISKALEKHSIHISDDRIQGLVEAFLDDLKFIRQIQKRIALVYEKLIGREVFKYRCITEAYLAWSEADSEK